MRVRRRSFRSETTSLAPHSLSPSPLACAGAEAYACYLALEMLASPEQQIVKVLAGTQVVVAGGEDLRGRMCGAEGVLAGMKYAGEAVKCLRQ